MLLLVLENLPPNQQLWKLHYMYMIKWYIEGQIAAMILCAVNLGERVI